MTQILVPGDAVGLSRGEPIAKLGLRASDTVEVVFDSVRVPLDHVIGQAGRGFAQQMSQFHRERLILSYYAVGAMSAILASTVDYVKNRRTFGVRVADHQWVAYNIAGLLAEVEALRGYCIYVAARVTEGRGVGREASVVKLQAGRLLRKVADTCLQFHGGAGYVAGTEVERFYRDSRVISLTGGGDEVMLRILSRMNGLGRSPNDSA